MRTILMLTLTALLGLSVAACGNTWEGLKKDTSQNTQATGHALQQGGKKIDE